MKWISFLGFLVVWGVSSPAQEFYQPQVKLDRKGSPRPVSTYKKCLADYIASWKQKGKKASGGLDACLKRFPALVTYKECKQVSVRKYRDKETSSQNALKYCDRILAAASYREEDPLPLQTIAGRSYFAGIDMRTHRPWEPLSLPNFDCQPLNEVMAGKRPALKVHLDGRKPLRAGFCRLAVKPGLVFSDVVLVFIVSRALKKLIPYVGEAHYRGDFSEQRVKQLATDMLKQLGPRHKRHDYPTRTELGRSALGSLSKNGFPLKLCERNKGVKRMGVIWKRSGQAASFPQRLTYVNLRNLCPLAAR